MLARSSSCRGNPADFSPHHERRRPHGSMLVGGDVVAAETEEVVDLIVGGEETLHLPRQLETLHLPFSSSRRLVRILRPIVEALMPAMLDTGHQLLLRRAVAAKLIGNHDARRPALPLQQLAE